MINNIKEYSNSRGNILISDYIQSLFLKGRPDHAKKILKTLERLENNSLESLLKIGLIKKIKGYDNIFELIINWKNANYRIFFSIINNKIYITSILYKKKQKTPFNEIILADKRKKELDSIFYK
jgi:phage-related protein